MMRKEKKTKTINAKRKCDYIECGANVHTVSVRL